MPNGRSNCVDQAPALTTTLPTIWLAVLVTTRQPDPSGNSFSTRSARTVPPASVKSRARVATRRRGLRVWPFFGKNTARVMPPVSCGTSWRNSSEPSHSAATPCVFQRRW